MSEEVHPPVAPPVTPPVAPPVTCGPTPPDAPAPGLYEHHKGGRYRVVDVARHSETEEWLVVYRALYGDAGLWVRPLAMFVGPVAPGTPEARPRFLRLDD